MTGGAGPTGAGGPGGDRPRRAEIVASALVLLLGAGHAAAAALQGAMNEDGIGYLDVGAAWLRGDWSNAVSATWSPLYALLMSPATLDGLPVGARLPVVHGLGFLIFVGAFVAFRAMWRELGRAAARHAASPPDTVPVPTVPWTLVGAALFAWASLNLIEIWSVTPDMLLAGLLFVAATLLLRQRHRAARRTAFLFGLVLGLGYLAKPVMFPLGFGFLAIAGVAWAAGRPRREALGAAGVAVAGFFLIAAPWVAVVSAQRGAPTFGESGNLTYIRYVNDVSYPFWSGDGSAAGEPRHPVPRVAELPDVWAFGDPSVGGTYPPGFDPAHWYEGVRPRLAPGRQIEEVAGNLAFTFELVVRRLGIPVGALLVLLWLSCGRRGRTLRQAVASPAGVGPAAVTAIGFLGVALYLPVLAEGRYLAAFLVLAFGGALALARVPAARGGEAAARAAAVVIVAGLVLEIVAFNLAGAAQVARLDVTPRGGLGLGPSAPAARGEAARGTPATLRHAGGDHVAVARALHAAGIEGGTEIGIIGYGFDSYWAWLADLRVVAEMPGDSELYWRAGAARRARLEAAFRTAGSAAIVAEVRPDTLPEGWEELGRTGAALRRLGP